MIRARRMPIVVLLALGAGAVTPAAAPDSAPDAAREADTRARIKQQAHAQRLAPVRPPAGPAETPPGDASSTNATPDAAGARTPMSRARTTLPAPDATRSRPRTPPAASQSVADAAQRPHRANTATARGNKAGARGHGAQAQLTERTAVKKQARAQALRPIRRPPAPRMSPARPVAPASSAVNTQAETAAAAMRAAPASASEPVAAPARRVAPDAMRARRTPRPEAGGQPQASSGKLSPAGGDIAGSRTPAAQIRPTTASVSKRTNTADVRQMTREQVLEQARMDGVADIDTQGPAPGNAHAIGAPPAADRGNRLRRGGTPMPAQSTPANTEADEFAATGTPTQTNTSTSTGTKGRTDAKTTAEPAARRPPDTSADTNNSPATSTGAGDAPEETRDSDARNAHPAPARPGRQRDAYHGGLVSVGKPGTAGPRQSLSAKSALPAKSATATETTETTAAAAANAAEAEAAGDDINRPAAGSGEVAPAATAKPVGGDDEGAPPRPPAASAADDESTGADAGVDADWTPAPFKAVYRVQHAGARVGETTLTLTPLGEQRWRLRSRTSPRGLAALVHPGDVVETSDFDIVDGTLTTLRYEFDDGSRAGRNDTVAEFDWRRGWAYTRLDGEEVAVTLQPGAVDRLLVQVALMRDLSDGASDTSYVVIDRNEASQYVFADRIEEVIDVDAGQFSAQRLRRQRPGSSRATLVWAAPDLGYLPVKIAQFKDGRPTIVLSLTGYDLDFRAPGTDTGDDAMAADETPDPSADGAAGDLPLDDANPDESAGDLPLDDANRDQSAPED